MSPTKAGTRTAAAIARVGLQRVQAPIPLKLWYKIGNLREDLREGKSLDALEFGVHLGQVHEGRANADCQEPKRFFEAAYYPAPGGLYASDTEEEKRWLDGVVARKKGLGF